MKVGSRISCKHDITFELTYCETDMFRALQKADLPKETVFTVTVGPSSKETEAAYHLLEPTDVVDSIGLLVGTVTIEDIEKAGAEVKPSL